MAGADESSKQNNSINPIQKQCQSDDVLQQSPYFWGTTLAAFLLNLFLYQYFIPCLHQFGGVNFCYLQIPGYSIGVAVVTFVSILFPFWIQKKKKFLFLLPLSFHLGLAVIATGWVSVFLFLYCLHNPLDWKNLTWLGKSPLTGAARIAALSALFFIAVLLSRAAQKYYMRVYYTSWWNPSDRAPGKPLSWDDVAKIIKIAEILSCPDLVCPKSPPPTCSKQGCPIKEVRYACPKDEGNDFDPVWYKRRPRSCVSGEWFRDVLAVGLVVAAFMAAVFLVFADFQFLKPILKEISIPGAILAAIGSGIMAVLQLSSNVRSKNRQEWINEIRNLLGEIMDIFMRFPEDNISKLPYGAYREDQQTKKAEVFRDLNSKRIKLEMMLNPSEKEHRALMMLIRVALGMRIPNVDALVIRKLNLEPAIKEADDPNGDDHGHINLVSMIFRLSHVVLKREWERVKHAQ